MVAFSGIKFISLLNSLPLFYNIMYSSQISTATKNGSPMGIRAQVSLVSGEDTYHHTTRADNANAMGSILILATKCNIGS